MIRISRALVATTAFVLLVAIPTDRAIAGGSPIRVPPAGINRWSTRGPGAALVFALAVSASDPNTIYAGAAGTSFGAGMYKTTDGGQRWYMADRGLLDRNMTRVAVSATSPDLAYAGTANTGVYKTVDGGDTWTHTNWHDIETKDVTVLVVDPFDDQTVYASAMNTDEPGGWSLQKTTDGGQTWTDLSANVSYQVVESLVIDPTSPDTLYAGTGQEGVFKSTDGGSTFQPMNNGLGSSLYEEIVALDPQDPSTLYAGATDESYSEEGTAIFKSTDGGGSWSQLDMTSFGDTRQALDIAVDPISPTTVYASMINVRLGKPGGVFKTTDGGESWTAIDNGLYSPEAFQLAVNPVMSGTVYAATFGGVFETVDGGDTWIGASTGLLGANAESVAVDPTAPSTVYAGTYYAGVFRSTNDGGRWIPARDGLPPKDAVDSLAVDPLAPSTVYAATSGGGVYKSNDRGGLWGPANVGLTDLDVRSIAVDGFAEGVVYAGTAIGVFKSPDGGRHWGLSLSSTYTYALVVDPQTPGVVYAAVFSAGVYKSSDGGRNWTAMDTGLTGAYILALTIDPADPQTLYAGASCLSPDETCVFKTVDGGASWQPMDTGMQGTEVHALAVDPGDPSTVYAGTFGSRVFRSTDGGISWSRFDTGLHLNKVYSLAVGDQGTVFAATYGSGVFVYQHG